MDRLEAFVQRLRVNLSSGESLGAAIFVDLLEVIEEARTQLPGGNLPWPTEMDYAYRAGLVIAEARIRAVFEAWPEEPANDLSAPLIRDLTSLVQLRSDLEREL